MKLFLRYLLTLCALLLSTHHPALAKQGLGQPSHASAVSHAKALFTNIGCQSSSAPNVAQASPKTAQGYKVVLTDIEEEDYEFLSFKKYLESNGFVAALFQVLTLALFICSLVAALHYCKHFIYTSSKRRFLLFQVFRI